MVKEMHGIMTESEVYYNTKKYYADSMKQKGKSNGGTSVGHWMHSFTKYSDAAIKGFDVYHSCRIDYYFQSLGKQTTTVTGAVGFASNALGIFVDTYAADGTNDAAGTGTNAASDARQVSVATERLNFSALNNALASHNAAGAGQFMGKLFFKLLAVEVPDYDQRKKDPFPFRESQSLQSLVETGLF
jgi:hypothetical protein